MLNIISTLIISIVLKCKCWLSTVNIICSCHYYHTIPKVMIFTSNLAHIFDFAESFTIEKTLAWLFTSHNFDDKPRPWLSVKFVTLVLLTILLDPGNFFPLFMHPISDMGFIHRWRIWSLFQTTEFITVYDIIGFIHIFLFVKFVSFNLFPCRVIRT